MFNWKKREQKSEAIKAPQAAVEETVEVTQSATDLVTAKPVEMSVQTSATEFVPNATQQLIDLLQKQNEQLEASVKDFQKQLAELNEKHAKLQGAFDAIRGESAPIRTYDPNRDPGKEARRPKL